MGGYKVSLNAINPWVTFNYFSYCLPTINHFVDYYSLFRQTGSSPDLNKLMFIKISSWHCETHKSYITHYSVSSTQQTCFFTDSKWQKITGDTAGHFRLVKDVGENQ